MIVMVDDTPDSSNQSALRAALHEVWLLIHVIRFADQEGTLQGPDNFYNGVLQSQRQVEDFALRHGMDRIYDHVDHLPTTPAPVTVCVHPSHKDRPLCGCLRGILRPDLYDVEQHHQGEYGCAYPATPDEVAASGVYVPAATTENTDITTEGYTEPVDNPYRETNPNGR